MAAASLGTVVRRGSLLLTALLVLLTSALLGAGPASAHASLVSSTPTQDAALGPAPQQVSFTFSEDVQQPAYVAVTGPDGDSLLDGDPTVRGATVTQAVAGGGAGRWTAAYRVVSEDGHPISGEISFEVARGAAPRADRAASSEQPAPADSDGTPAPRATAPGQAEAQSQERTQAETSSPGFLSEHVTHLLTGGVLLALAAGLLVLSRRST